MQQQRGRAAGVDVVQWRGVAVHAGGFHIVIAVAVAFATVLPAQETDPSRTAVLLMHHRKLDRWLQPGGHADGDTDMRLVALKECAEETGVSLESIRLLGDGIFDVDIHATQEPHPDAQEHHHIDIRYLVEIDDRIPVPGNEESFELRWVEIPMVARLSNSRSTLRMLDKTRKMR